MEFLNRIQLRGIVGRCNIERIEYKQVASFSLITNYAYKDKNGYAVIDSQWFQVRAFEGPLSPKLSLVKKGAVVEVEGRLANPRIYDKDQQVPSVPLVIARKVTVLGQCSDDNNIQPQKPRKSKALFFLFGSLSVLQELENKGLKDRLSADMEQVQAFNAAQQFIAEIFGEGFNDYDLDLEVEHYVDMTDEEIQKAYDHDVDFYVRSNDLEEEFLKEYDESGNAQGWTAFLF